MKKWMYLLICLFTGWTASAQWVWTPEAGVNITKDNGADQAKMGFKAGMGVTYELKPSFGIKSGLFMVRRSGSRERGGIDWFETEGGGMITQNWRTKGKEHKYYLQVPIMAQWTWRFYDDVKLTAGVGPYIAVGIAGKWTDNITFMTSSYVPPKGVEQEGDYNWTDRFDNLYAGVNYDPFKDHGEGLEHTKGDPRFDWGGTAAVGIAIRRVTFQVGYDLNMGKGWHGQNDLRFRSHTVSFSFGYIL